MTANSRIAWLSPYGPQSDIGAYTRCLLPHFSNAEEGAFECDLFVNANGPTYDSPVPAMDIPESPAIGEILSRYDAAFFNLGNNAQNHTRIIGAMRQVPGVAVLHDFSYHHFFAYRCFEELRSPPAYARLLRDHYGSTGFNMALRSGVITRDATLYAPWDGDNVSDYPLVDPMVTLAAAAVVHSRFMEERVARVFKGPILRLFLPRDQKAAPSLDDIMRWRGETGTKERCQFAAFGHINRAKCFDVMIQAFGQSKLLRAHAQLVIAGKPDDREYVREIEALTTSLGLSKHVIFEYGVTNERLGAIKSESDVFLNLRYPNTEGASGSLVEMMNTGRPVIVYRAGCYAEIEPDAAVLIERADGIEAVIAAMENLASAPERRIQIGASALASLREQGAADYVRQLKKFSNDIKGDLKRRSRFIAPVREAMSWTQDGVAAEDIGWFADLTRARRGFWLMEHDPWVRSPEVFLKWPMDDLIAFVAHVLLHVPAPFGLPRLLVEYAQRLGRWRFYQLIAKVRLYQSLCEKLDISKRDLETYGERIADVAFWDIATRLQPESFVHMLYLCVLARGWGAGERDAWVRRIRQGLPASAVLIEFLGSAEYRQTFSDDAMAEVEDWARHQGKLASARRVQPRAKIAWPAESEVRFSEDSPTVEGMLGQFWHRPDAQGRWSNGRVGDLCFLVPDNMRGQGTTLDLRLRVAGTGITGHRKITAHCEEKELASITVRDDAPLSWSVPLPSSTQSKAGVYLLLTADRDFTPSAHGKSGDKRSLGIMLMGGKLAIAAAAAPQKADKT
jgi:glycosyltransferase involved in cell wall biosynthesis